jgi:hypothetical protein
LIYFSPVPYASYAQRPHYMAKAFADNGYDDILWIDPYPTRLPSVADFRRLRMRKAEFAFPVDERIHVIRPSALPIEPLPMSGIFHRFVMWRDVCDRIMAFANGTDHCVLGVGRPTKLAEWALRHVPHGRSFADVLDNFPYFYGGVSRLSMRMRLRELLRMVDDVCCSSTALALEVRRARPDVVTVLNGYSTASLPEPSSAGQRHCIGYVGMIADWFDWPLVRAIATALPHVPIRLFGPEFIARPANLPANIELLGEVPQEGVADIVKEFAAGLIPFRINALTAGVDPIKFYEYRSLGVPVWSTAFGEMLYRNGTHGVTHISHDSDWSELWDGARAHVGRCEEIASFRRSVDWSRRFDPILARSQSREHPRYTNLEHLTEVAGGKE